MTVLQQVMGDLAELLAPEETRGPEHADTFAGATRLRAALEAGSRTDVLAACEQLRSIVGQGELCLVNAYRDLLTLERMGNEGIPIPTPALLAGVGMGDDLVARLVAERNWPALRKTFTRGERVIAWGFILPHHTDLFD